MVHSVFHDGNDAHVRVRVRAGLSTGYLLFVCSSRRQGSGRQRGQLAAKRSQGSFVPDMWVTSPQMSNKFAKVLGNEQLRKGFTASLDSGV